MLRLAALALLLAAGCKQDCETLCQQQLGCAATAAPDASIEVGPRCQQLCVAGGYQPSDACATCLDSEGICAPLLDGGYAYQGCESVCPDLH